MSFNIDSTIYKYLEVAKDVIQRDKLDSGLWYSNISSTELTPVADRDSLVIKSTSMKNTSGFLKDDSTDITVAELLALRGLTFDVDADGIIYLKNGTNTYYDITTLTARTTSDSFTPAHNNKYLDYYTRYTILNNYLNDTKTPISNTHTDDSDIGRFNTFITASNITKKSKYEHLIKCLKEYYHMGLLFYNYKYIDKIDGLLCAHLIFDGLDGETGLINTKIKELAISYGTTQTSEIKTKIISLIKLGYTTIDSKDKGFVFKYYTKDDDDKYRSDSEYLIVSNKKELIKTAYYNIKKVYTNTNTVYNINNFITGTSYTKAVSIDFSSKITVLITELNTVSTNLDTIKTTIQSSLRGKLTNYINYINKIKLYFTNLKTIFDTIYNEVNYRAALTTLKQNTSGTITNDISSQQDDAKDYSTSNQEYIIGDNLEKISYTELDKSSSTITPITLNVTIQSTANAGHITTSNEYNYLHITGTGTDSFNNIINIDLSNKSENKTIYIRENTPLTFSVNRNSITDTFHLIDKNNAPVSWTHNGDTYTWTPNAKGTYKVYTIRNVINNPPANSGSGSGSGVDNPVIDPPPVDSSTDSGGVGEGFTNNIDIYGLIDNYFIIEVVSSIDFMNYYKSQFLETQNSKFNSIFDAFYSYDNATIANSFGYKNLKNIDTIKTTYTATALTPNIINYILLNADDLTRDKFANLNKLITDTALVSDTPELIITMGTDTTKNLLANLNYKCKNDMKAYFAGEFETDITEISSEIKSLDDSILKTKLQDIVTYYRQLKNINTVKTNFKAAISTLKEDKHSITSDSEKKTVTTAIETNKESIKDYEKRYKESTDSYNTKNAELNNIIKSNVYNNIFLYITIIVLIIICLGVIYINNHKASLKTQYAVMVITFLLLYYIIYTNVTISVTEDFSQCSAISEDLSSVSDDLMSLHTSILSYLTHNIDNDFYDSTNKSLQKEKDKYANYAKSSKSSVNNLETVLNDEFINAIKSKELVKFLILFTAICIVCFIIQTNVEDLTTTSIMFIILFIIILAIYFYNINLMTRTKHDNKYWNHRMTMK